MKRKSAHITLLLLSLSFMGWGQDMALNDPKEEPWNRARVLAFEGNHISAQDTLVQFLDKYPSHTPARELLGRTYSWEGNYDHARKEFNTITSKERGKSEVWIAAIKNELYAKNNATALGLANKALYYLKQDEVIERLRNLALQNIENKVYKRIFGERYTATPLREDFKK